jgi:hypothetical protein
MIPFEPGWPGNEVIEGLTLADSPWLMLSIRQGQQDRVWLRHFDVADGATPPVNQRRPADAPPTSTAGWCQDP